MDGWVGGWMDGWTDGRTDGRMDGWMDGWMDRIIDSGRRVTRTCGQALARTHLAFQTAATKTRKMSEKE